MGLELTFNAFIELNTCRNTGWSAGPIPSWAIDDHAERLGLTEDETEELHHLIRAMDGEFLKYAARKNEKKT